MIGCLPCNTNRLSLYDRCVSVVTFRIVPSRVVVCFVLLRYYGTPVLRYVVQYEYEYVPVPVRLVVYQIVRTVLHAHRNMYFKSNIKYRSGRFTYLYTVPSKVVRVKVFRESRVRNTTTRYRTVQACLTRTLPNATARYSNN